MASSSGLPSSRTGWMSAHAWSSSPLRRYVDLVNQRQLISVLREETPIYAKNDTALFAILRDFDAAGEWFRHALEIMTKQGNQHDAAHTYDWLGTRAYRKQDFDLAERWCRSALEIAEQPGRAVGWGR